VHGVQKNWTGLAASVLFSWEPMAKPRTYIAGEPTLNVGSRVTETD